MLYKDYTTKILDMEHMKVKEVEESIDKIILHVEMERREAKCPCGGAITEKVHDYRTQRVKDSPKHGRAVI